MYVRVKTGVCVCIYLCVCVCASFCTHSGKVFLRETFVLATLLDDLAHLQSDPIMVQLLRLPVQLCCVLGHQMLLVLPCRH